jgi:hypothetical protein
MHCLRGKKPDERILRSVLDCPPRVPHAPNAWSAPHREVSHNRHQFGAVVTF